ncbi:MAG: ribosome maturation factor RimP [Chitinophagaceae bacterium]
MDSRINDIISLVETIVTDPYFLVSAKIKPTNNIKLFLDGDQGITIETCVKINRQLYKLIEEKAWYPEGDFSLEVSSPGIDEPLVLHRQYLKNIGRKIEVTLNDTTIKNGTLTHVSEENFTIETLVGKGKKAEKLEINISFTDVKEAIIQVSF